MCASALLGSIGSSSAITLDVGLGDPLALGDVIHGIQAGGQVNRDVIMVNNLLSVGLGSSSIINSRLYERSVNVFNPLPAAVATGAQFASGIADGAVYLDITLTDSFRYLLAAYDGPRGGVEIWDIASLASGTTISIPRYAEPTGGDGTLVQSHRYRMTGWTLLNPGVTPTIPGNTSVPDAGATAMLLGVSMTALGAARRFLKF